MVNFAKIKKLKIYSVERLLYFQTRCIEENYHPITMSLTTPDLNRRMRVIVSMKEDHKGKPDVLFQCGHFETEYNIILKEFSEFKDGNISCEFESKLRDFDDRLIGYKISL